MVIIGNYVFLKYLGEDGVAAFSIACYCAPIAFMINNAIAQSAQPIINYNLLLNRKRSDQAMRLAVNMAIGFGIAQTVGMILFAEDLVGLFLDDSCNAYKIAVDGIPLFSLSFLFFAINIVYINYFQCIEKVKIAAILTIIRGYIMPIITFLGLPLLLSINGIWLAMPAAEFVTFIVLLYIVLRKKAKNEV